MKPFIHLFKTPKNHYFYDVNRNENVRVEKEVYEHLQKVLEGDSGGDRNPMVIEGIRRLKEEGYLSDNRIKEIEHPDTDRLSLYLSRKMNMLTIQLTQNCNLRCEYCAYTANGGTNRLHQNKTINLETIKKAILILRDNSVDSDSLSIGFYGGEPLIEFGLIKETVDFAKRELMGREINYTITTNSTLLTDEMLEFFEKEDFQLVLSLDGPKEINDKNRKFSHGMGSVYDKVIENITKIESQYKKLFKNLSINMVIDPTQNFDAYQKLFDNNHILEKVNITTTFVDDNYSEKEYVATETFAKQYEEAKHKYFLYYIGKAKLENRAFLSSLFGIRYKELLRGHRKAYSLGDKGCPSGPCIPGKQRLMVNVDGIFFPCERISETDTNNTIGDVDKGIDLYRAKTIMNVAKRNENECKNCFAFRYCGLCVKAYDGERAKEGSIYDECQDTRNNLHNRLIEMESIQEAIESI